MKVSPRRLFSMICLFTVFAVVCRGAEPELVTLPVVERQPVLEQPLVFPRMRLVKKLCPNYYQNSSAIGWIDRPLYHDRDIDDGIDDHGTEETFRRQLGIAMSYEVDGLSMLWHGPMHDANFLRMIETANSLYAERGTRLLLSVIGFAIRGRSPAEAADQFEPVLRRYLASPAATRINGQAVLGSYNADDLKPADLAEFLRLLRERCGEPFLFVASIGHPAGLSFDNWPRFQGLYHNNNGRLPATEVAAVQAYLRSYLDVCDGLLVNNSNHLDTTDNYLDEDFYQNVVCRLYSGLLNEPAYKGKLLGLSASLGYINHVAGGTQLEDGTRNLRATLGIALGARPDFVMMPEWNEYDENTCLEPTVNRGLTTKRIIRYFMQKRQGAEHLSPLPGDDVAIPNLIVSARTVVSLGERYYVELLNVPDTAESRPYTVTCELKNQLGETVMRVAGLAFDAAVLAEHRIVAPTEEIAGCRTLTPVLTIQDAAGNELGTFADSLPITRVQATWNDNLTCLKQALRDIPPLAVFDVAMRPGKTPGTVDFDVHALSPHDPIRHLEIMEDDVVAYSYDIGPAGDLKPDELRLHLGYCSLREIKPFTIDIDVEKGEIHNFDNRSRTRSARESKWEEKPRPVIYWKSNYNIRGAIFTVTNKEEAVLRVKSELFDSRIPVSEIEALGRVRRLFEGNVEFFVETADRALDVPSPIRRPEITFATTLVPRNRQAVHRVRLITITGRIASRGPFLLDKDSGETIQLPVLSAATGGPVTVNIDPARCPQLDYDFGAVGDGYIRTKQGVRWYGTLGGGWNARGGSVKEKFYPEDATYAAPARALEDGKPCLVFDGKGTFCNFPSEAIPSRGPFAIELEVKPESLRKQYLIKCQNNYPGTLDVMIDDGHVRLEYHGMLREGEPPYFNTVSLSSTASLALNQWTTIKVSYDFSKLTLQVGDAAPESVAYSRPAWWPISPFALGGWGPDASLYFKGSIRALRIQHISGK